MAKPISTVQKRERTEEEQKQDTMNRLLTTLTDHPDGLQQTVKLLQELHESGILPALQSLLVAKEHVATIAVQQLLRPPVTNMINNAMAAGGALSSIDPETTKKLMGSLASGLAKAEEGIASKQTTGVWDLVKVMKDPDINRALTFGLNLLKGMGQGLQE
jgi:uncharacterized protein YjgD (DUF1641 family)